MKWRLGQALLPEHFYRQEFSLRQEWELRFAQSPLPTWGVGLAQWDEALVPRGFAKLGRLMAVFPRGQIAHVPGNVQPVHFDLNAADGVEVSLYAHLLSAPETVREEGAEGEAAGLELLQQKIELSPHRGHPAAVDSMKLAEFFKDPERGWTRKTTFVPPLLLLGSDPAFLRWTMERLATVLHHWREILLGDLETHALSTERVVRAHECLRRSHVLQATLAQIDGESPFRDADVTGPVLGCHPYELFSRLVELAIDVHTYQEDPQRPPRAAGMTYDHADPHGCFSRVLDELGRRTELPRGKVPYVPFAVQGDAAVCPFPAEARAAKEVYWLLHRRGPAARDGVRGLKLACRSRLELVHRHSLKGVPLRRVDPVPFRHVFAPEVEFYQLLPGEDWEHALREGNLAYFAEEGLKDCQAYLFWRSG